MAADAEILEIAGHDVAISNPDKVFFSRRGETKLDLIRFYLGLGDALMNAVGGRPTMLQRFPDGASGKSFYQKRVPANPPEWLRTTTVATVNGTTSRALVLADPAHVAWAVNLGCLGFHTWPFTVVDPGHADELRIDLDPHGGVDFEAVREAALEVRALLEELSIVGWPKTTGSKGIHVVIRLRPSWTSYDVRYAAVAVARELERRRPDLITAQWWKEERGSRVFVDYNQNAPHKTVFAPWSVRARVGAQVSTPLTWDEVVDVDPEALTMPVVAERVATSGDPWAGIGEDPQSLEPLLELHRRDRADGLMDAPWPPQYPKMPDEPPRVAPSRAKSEE